MRLKRFFDLVVAVIGLVLASPVMAVAAASVKLTTGGPVLHRTTRAGRDGVPFTLLKFRTMHVDDSGGPGITRSSDPRITSIGRILRRLKIDELPQLVNVVRGEMSLVGPRPEDPRYVAHYTAPQQRVLSLRPGITSPASVAFRDEERVIAARGGDVETVYREEILPAKLSMDLDYIERRSMWLDLTILLKTAIGVLVSPRRS